MGAKWTHVHIADLFLNDEAGSRSKRQFFKPYQLHVDNELSAICQWSAVLSQNTIMTDKSILTGIWVELG